MINRDLTYYLCSIISFKSHIRLNSMDKLILINTRLDSLHVPQWEQIPICTSVHLVGNLPCRSRAVSSIKFHHDLLLVCRVNADNFTEVKCFPLIKKTAFQD